MGIATVADTDHQPWGVTGAFSGPVEARARSVDHSCVGCHINTLNSCSGVEGTKISDCSQILIAGPADQLDPTTLSEGLITGGL